MGQSKSNELWIWDEMIRYNCFVHTYLLACLYTCR